MSLYNYSIYQEVVYSYTVSGAEHKEQIEKQQLCAKFYRILCGNWHIIACKNHTGITFTE